MEAKHSFHASVRVPFKAAVTMRASQHEHLTCLTYLHLASFIVDALQL
jgi:hypothetical protein